jgi:hypothetical protein
VVNYLWLLASPHFSRLSHKRFNFRGKKLREIKPVFRFSLQFLSKTFLNIIIIQRDIVINVKTCSVKYQLFLSDFNEILSFLERFPKRKAQISNFMKIRPVGAELFHADRRTDLTKLIVGFRNFTSAPKTGSQIVFKIQDGLLSWCSGD